MDRLCQCAEDAAFNAWPALKGIFHDGWIIRLSGGESRRTNSVWVIAPPRAPLARNLAFCERIYQSHQLPLIFRVRSLDAPLFERHLAREGFAPQDETLTLFLDLSACVQGQSSPSFAIAAKASREWICTHQRFTGRSDAHTQLHLRRFELISLPTAFASVKQDGRIVSLAYGVVHDRIMSLQWVATDPAYRQQGLSRGTLLGLFSWGIAQGASGACLQVQANNAPALALYRRLGFARELYRYHYRVR